MVNARTPTGYVVWQVSDFGLSWVLAGMPGAGSQGERTHVSRAFQGTMFYIAPETAMYGERWGSPCPWAWWSHGAVLSRVGLLVGRLDRLPRGVVSLARPGLL